MTTTDDTTTTGAAPVDGDGFEAAFGRIGSALDELAESPAWMLSEQAVQTRFGELSRLRARIEEVSTRLLASVAGGSCRGWPGRRRRGPG